MQRKKPKAKEKPPAPETIDPDAVTRLAYELYLRRGGEHGHDVEDWLMAEQFLIERQARSAPAKKTAEASRRLEDKYRRR